MADRSFLFIAGDTPANIQNADVFEADAVIFDLEDAVAPDEKDGARRLIREYLHDLHPEGLRVYVRVNQPGTPWHDKDLAVLAGDGLIDGIVLPKATEASVAACAHALDQTDTITDIIALIETPLGMIDADRVASHPWVTALMFGAEDYALAMHLDRHHAPVALNHARNTLAVSARAHGKQAVDTPYPNIRETDLFEAETKAAHAMGFSGKACIHPSHVAFINHVFSPSDEDIRWAKKIVAAYDKHRHRGVFALDGKMVDQPIVARARAILAETERK